MAKVSIDPRISGMFADQPRPIQFLAMAVCALLGEKKTGALVDEFQGRDVDWREKVAGRPLHYFNGKSAAALRDREGFGEDQIQEIRDAYEARGMVFPETDEPGRPVAGSVEEGGPLPLHAAPPAEGEAPEAGGEEGEPATASGDDLAGALTDADAPAGELAAPTPGAAPVEAPPRPAPPDDLEIAGHKFSDLRGKTDEQLLAMPNIGKATLTRIRQLEAEGGAG